MLIVVAAIAGIAVIGGVLLGFAITRFGSEPEEPVAAETTSTSTTVPESTSTTSTVPTTTLPPTTTTTSSPILDSQALAALAGAAVYKVETSGCDLDGIGSGFAVDEHHIVTNRHVVETDTAPTLRTCAGESFSGRVIGWYEDPDIAVIEVDRYLPTFLEWADTASLAVGQQLTALGYPLPAHDFSVNPGVIASFIEEESRRTAIGSDANLDYGNSGGPSLTEIGAVAGVVTWMDLNPEGFQFVPVVVTHDELDEPLTRIISNPEVPTVDCGSLTEALPEIPSPIPPPTEPLPPTEPDPPDYPYPEPPFYTVFLDSLRTNSNSYADAWDSAYRQAETYQVLTDVLLSDDFGSLNLDYWVVCTGVFYDRSEAIAYAELMKGIGHPDAYAREVAWS